MDAIDALEPLVKKYVAPSGEGTNMATQAMTAVNKLIYMWYNNGDVYDCTNRKYAWGNKIESYANWLYKYTQCEDILDAVRDCHSDEEYEEILENLAYEFLNPNYLEYLEKMPKVDSIYTCEGPFQCEYGVYSYDCSGDMDDDDGWIDDERRSYGYDRKQRKPLLRKATKQGKTRRFFKIKKRSN